MPALVLGVSRQVLVLLLVHLDFNRLADERKLLGRGWSFVFGVIQYRHGPTLVVDLGEYPRVVYANTILEFFIELIKVILELGEWRRRNLALGERAEIVELGSKILDVVLHSLDDLVNGLDSALGSENRVL